MRALFALSIVALITVGCNVEETGDKRGIPEASAPKVGTGTVAPDKSMGGTSDPNALGAMAAPPGVKTGS